jgi:hypothetical protein
MQAVLDMVQLMKPNFLNPSQVLATVEIRILAIKGRSIPNV